MTIGKKLFTGYALVLALLLAITVVGVYALNSVRQNYDRLVEVNERLADAGDEISLRVRDQIAVFRGALLYPNRREEYLDELQAVRQRFDTIIDQLRAQVATDEERAILNDLDNGQAELSLAQDRALALLNAGEGAEDIALGDLQAVQLSNSLLQRATDFRNLQAARVRAGQQEVAEDARRLTLLMLIASAAAVVLGLAISTYLGRSITGQLQDSIMRLSASAAQILSTTAEVASGTAETATAVNETTATVEEVKQTAQVASQKAKQVSDSAREMTDVARSGRGSIEDTIEVMQNIQSQMESVAGSIVQLAEQSQAIGEVITTVNDLAEQSNLLAVNAAIEATRAGEHGKGFAVVAQEVRSLASQSKDATRQVRAILGDIQKATNTAVLATEEGNKAVDEGVRQTEATAQAINRLADSVEAAAQAATQISASNQQQMVGMDQVALAMDNIKQASSQNVAGTRQAESAAKDLQDLGRRLTRLISATSA
ncbi:MAG: methyl-accepting chemotaxis protein [Trueperaceae bacterium]